MINLDGFCPMGCGQTLRAEETRAVNRIVCWGSGCPEPLAASRILQDSETEHVVQFGGSGFTLRHPLRERLGDALMECDLHLLLMALPGPPDGRPGRFTAREQDGQLVLKKTAEQPSGTDAS